MHRGLEPAPTPYIVHAWERHLRKGGLAKKYPSLVQNLHEGFNLLFPQVDVTQTPENRPSVAILQSKFNTIIAAEIHKK